jgi:hypothetical protein
MNLKAATLAFLNLKEIDHDTLYGFQDAKATFNQCAVLSYGEDMFIMGIYQKYDGKKRFISIYSTSYGVLFVSTPFQSFQDNALNDLFVLPSDSYPDMIRGGYTKTRCRGPIVSFLDSATVTWGNAECQNNYHLVALADKVVQLLDGVTVKDSSNKAEWVIQKSFEAVRKDTLNTDKPKLSFLRILIKQNDRGETQIVLMGFNKQSLTLNIAVPIQKSYHVDVTSHWRRPARPYQRETLFDTDYEPYAYSNVRGFHTTTIWVFHYFDVGFWNRHYSMQQVFYKREHILTGEVVVTGTPQVKTGYNYRNWYFRTVYLTDRFHYVLRNRAHHTSPMGHIFSLNDANMNLEDTVKHPEYSFNWFLAVWDSMIGRTCRRHTDWEEVYLAPDFQLLSFEGEYSPTMLKVKNGVFELDGCDLI